MSADQGATAAPKSGGDFPATLPAEVSRLRQALAGAGFDASRVSGAAGPDSGVGLVPLPAMALRLPPGDPLGVLIALFVHGATQSEDSCDRALAPLGLDGAERLGLVAALGRGEARGLVRLAPFGDLVLASDRLGRRSPDFVMGAAPSTGSLANLTVRRPVRDALDLGTGTGALAFLASRHSERVTATDVNPRALAFARFNAALNQVTNVDLVEGPWFEPVVGRRFDLVVSNPPFVVSPDTDYLFRDGPESGDAVSRALVSQAPEYLFEGGLAQFLISWIHSAEGSWSDPVREWARGSACDTWLLHAESDSPVSYAVGWNDHLRDDPARHAATLDRWLAWFTAAGVEAIGFGLVTLRSKSGPRPDPIWFRADKLPSWPVEPAGEQLWSLIEAHDTLAHLGGAEALLDACPVTEPAHRLEQALSLDGGRYEVVAAIVRMRQPLAFTAEVDVYAATLLTLLDGERTLREAARIAAAVLEPNRPADGEVDTRTARLVALMSAVGLVRL